MLDLLNNFFEQINSTDIRYCHWKSNARLHKSLDGRTDLDLLIHPKDQIEFKAIIGELDFKNPLQVVELNVCWQMLRFNKPGDYLVCRFCEGEIVGERKFRVSGPQQKMLETDETEVR